MLVFGSPKRWDRCHIIPQLAVYTTYIPLIYCLPGVLYATYHLLGEPETTIDVTLHFCCSRTDSCSKTFRDRSRSLRSLQEEACIFWRVFFIGILATLPKATAPKK